MTNRRYIASILATAAATDVQMPWHRDRSAAHRMAKQTNNVVRLRVATPALRRAA